MANEAAGRDEDAATEDHRHESMEGIQHDEDVGTPILTEGTEYQEVTSIESIPTKTGDEIPRSDTPFESDRPHSAGSTHSGHFEVDNATVAAELAEIDAKRKDNMVESEPLMNTRLLTRPDESDVAGVNATFTFRKASQQQMDFTGTRKGPASTVVNTEEPPVEKLHHNDTITNADAGGELDCSSAT